MFSWHFFGFLDPNVVIEDGLSISMVGYSACELLCSVNLNELVEEQFDEAKKESFSVFFGVLAASRMLSC
jgi:hypothetical protein